MNITEAFVRYDLEELQLQGKATKTRRNYRSALNSFLRYTPDIPVQMVTYQDFTNWRVEMMRDGKTPSYIGSNLSRFRSVLTWLRIQGVQVIDPAGIKRPKIVQKDPTWLTVEELTKLLSVIESPRDKSIFASLFGTGARISELLSLDRDSIRGNEAYIRGKGDKIGTLTFDPNALKYIETYMETRKDELRPLFLSSHHRRITASRVAQLLHEYADLAGIDKNVTPHVLRHSFATDLKMNGADIYDIKEQLRHERISSTQIYVHIDDRKKREDYQRFHTAVPMV